MKLQNINMYKEYCKQTQLNQTGKRSYEAYNKISEECFIM